MIESNATALRAYYDSLRRRLLPVEEVPHPSKSKNRSAAVLVPLIERRDGLHVIYTRRSDRLASHRGQVAFPGGRFDPRDAHLLAAALRETDEEIGIPPENIEVLGSFKGQTTRSTIIDVTPFVGVVRGAIAMRPDPKEVAEIFEVPLAALTDRRYRGEYRWMRNGSASFHPAIMYGGQTIWGLTYGLTLRFLELSREGGSRGKALVSSNDGAPS